MAIFKAQLDSEYQVLSNKTAQDNRLSFEARGMLVLLLSMPADWSVNVSWLQKQSKAGRDKVNRIIAELIECGYMRKDQPRNQQGKFTSQDYFVYSESETATELPANGFPVNGLPANGKTPTTKETSLESKKGTNNVRPDGLTPAKIKDEMNTAFEAFWECWKACKKKMGVKNSSTRLDTIAKWEKHFTASWWKSRTISDFENEVTAIMRYADSIHNPEDDFCPARNMMTGKFFTGKGWQGE